MVYDKLPRTIKHHRLIMSVALDGSHLTLIVRRISIAILRTCRTIYEEAGGIVKDTIAKFIVEQPMRMIVTEDDYFGDLSEFMKLSAMIRRDILARSFQDESGRVCQMVL